MMKITALLALVAGSTAKVLYSKDSSVSVGDNGDDDRVGPSVTWTPGHTCPAGARNDKINDNPAYGIEGFDWVGDTVGYDDVHIGSLESCCQDGGGDGLDGPGIFYSLCNPELGCNEEGKLYTCTVYTNVTGTKPAPGRFLGRSQSPILSSLKPAKTTATATPFANPWTGACKAASNAATGYDEMNATMIATAAYTFEQNDPYPTSVTFFNISGAICAPQCGCITPQCKQSEFNNPRTTCPTTNLPLGTTATPRCTLITGMENTGVDGNVPPLYGCALMCDPSDPSGTGGAKSKCPAGATCQRQYSEAAIKKRGIFNTGVCTYLK